MCFVLNGTHQFRSINEMVQLFVAGMQNIIPAACPPKISIMYKGHRIAYLHNAVHVVCVHYGGDVKIPGDLTYQFVNEYSGWRIESGVRLVAKKIFWFDGYGPAIAALFFIPPLSSEGYSP